MTMQCIYYKLWETYISYTQGDTKSMKKFISLFLAVLMICALCACTAAENPAPSPAPDKDPVANGTPATERMSYMYNYFVLCGPADDPAGVKGMNVLDAFAAIADGGYTFVSRGDGSGTHTKELALWPADLGITAEPETFAAYKDWYVSSNAGMGTCLTMANEQGAYILSDKATFLTFKSNQPDADLEILIEADESMINTYSLLAVDPDAKFVDANGNEVGSMPLNTVGADALINWLLSEEGKQLAAEYGYAEYGEYLFYIMEDGPVSAADIPEATDETKLIRISTTTSVNDSGLLGYLIPIFEDKYGYDVEIFSAGTGKAIANAKMGNADLILVHAKAQEEAFIADGFARLVDGPVYLEAAK